MFQFIYNLVDHAMLHMWDVLCLGLLVVMLVVGVGHVIMQKKRERDFEEELDRTRQEG